MDEVDAIVIGSGQAGPFLAAKLAAAGRRTVLIEREHLGGTCVNDGCIPTKTLVASARAAWVARNASDWGVHIDGAVRVDMSAVKQRKDRVVAQSVASLTQWLSSLPNLRVVRAHARFTAAHEVQADGERLRAPLVVVNTGGRPVLPAWPGIDTVPVLTNVQMMALAELPRHIVVAGASYIGLEFAQMQRRFGAEVTVLEVADRAIAREDHEVSAEVRSILEREGVRFHFGVRDVRVGPRGSDIRITGTDATGAHQAFDASHLLAAVGRRPNTDDLGLEAAGIRTDTRGFIVVDDRLQTSVPGVYALGDVNGRGAFTHTSYHDHEIVAANLLEGGARSVRERGAGGTAADLACGPCARARRDPGLHEGAGRRRDRTHRRRRAARHRGRRGGACAACRNGRRHLVPHRAAHSAHPSHRVRAAAHAARPARKPDPGDNPMSASLEATAPRAALPPFGRDLLAGLSQPSKSIPCTWLYDRRGSELFEEITELPEYYPSRTEHWILERSAGEIAAAAGPHATLVELGSGSSRKTRLLLAALDRPAAYVPVDISAQFLVDAVQALQRRFPPLAILPLVADFAQPEPLPLRPHGRGRMVVFFPGSTIGNFAPDAAIAPGALLVIGADATHDPRHLLPAYDDSRGITAAFNRNLLVRANRELGANFSPSAFRHQARWDATRQRIEMHLVAEFSQQVTVLGHSFRFAMGESIHTESAYKYGVLRFQAMARRAGWAHRQLWTDGQSRFAVHVFDAVAA
jgi:dimethylhistidine N-methyltransferase